MTSFKKGQIPKHWSSQYNVSKDMAVGDWIVDLTTRSIALNRYAEILDRSSSIPKLDRARNCTFWLGGMFSPEAFITATRQQTAQVRIYILITLLFLK